MMDDLQLGYVIHFTFQATAGLIRDEDSHAENLVLIEKACKQAHETKDYHFFNELGNVLKQTRTRLAPPSSHAFKAKVEALVETYGPPDREGIKAEEKNRFANYIHAMKQAVVGGAGRHLSLTGCGSPDSAGGRNFHPDQQPNLTPIIYKSGRSRRPGRLCYHSCV